MNPYLLIALVLYVLGAATILYIRPSKDWVLDGVFAALWPPVLTVVFLFCFVIFPVMNARDERRRS